MTTTQTLAIQARKGHEPAFSALFDRLYGLTYQRAYKRLQCHEDAQDATSEVFVKAWHRLGKWNPKGGDFEGWFYRITENTLIDAYRVRQRYQQKYHRHSETLDTDGYSILATIPDSRYNPLDAMVVSEGIMQIEAALAEIPIEHRHRRLAWMLRHFEGYGYKEIVRILQRPETTCKMWVYRCNEYLKNELQDSRDSREAVGG